MAKVLVVTPPGPESDELSMKLQEKGYDVIVAATGAEAFPVALREMPDVVLMDSALSAMDRWHAVKRLNGESRTSRIPVLTLSSDAHSPAGLQRVLDKVNRTLGPATVATPVSSSARVAARPGQTRTAGGEATERRSRQPTLSPAPSPRHVGPTRPPGSVPPVRHRTTVTPAAPPSRDEAKTEPTAPRRLARPVAGDEGKLLVVDDNDLNRDMLARRLTRRGYQVESAPDGETAKRMIAEGDFDLVLLDWMMPGLSGIDVLRALRQTHSQVELPVIMATAKSEAEDVVEALREGANDYVTKPLNFDVVHARLKTQLQLRDAHRELQHSERRYRALVENTGDMIVQYRLDGQVLYVSPASLTLLGLEPDVVKGRSWYDGLHPVDRNELLTQQESGLPTNFTYVARMLTSDGSSIWCEVSCRVLRDKSTGEVERIQAACRDVTEHVERVKGDEPPLPLGGDIMAHPGWRANTEEPAPSRDHQPMASISANDPPPARPVTPIVVIGTAEGLDSAVLQGMTAEQIAARVEAALKSLLE